MSLCYVVARARVCGKRVRGVSCHAGLLAWVGEGTHAEAHAAGVAVAQAERQRAALIGLVVVPRGR